MFTTKEEIKTKLLDPIAIQQKAQWHSQGTHKMAVAVWFLDATGVKDAKKREEIMLEWAKTPSSFGANCSALSQSLGRETEKSKTDKIFGQFTTL